MHYNFWNFFFLGGESDPLFLKNYTHISIEFLSHGAKEHVCVHTGTRVGVYSSLPTARSLSSIKAARNFSHVLQYILHGSTNRCDEFSCSCKALWPRIWWNFKRLHNLLTARGIRIEKYTRGKERKVKKSRKERKNKKKKRKGKKEENLLRDLTQWSPLGLNYSRENLHQAVNFSFFFKTKLRVESKTLKNQKKTDRKQREKCGLVRMTRRDSRPGSLFPSFPFFSIFCYMFVEELVGITLF